MKIGDKVRFLSEVGGGVVTGFQGKDVVLVEDADGFDIPMPIRECVVIDTDDYNLKRKPGASSASEALNTPASKAGSGSAATKASRPGASQTLSGTAAAGRGERGVLAMPEMPVIPRQPVM